MSGEEGGVEEDPGGCAAGGVADVERRAEWRGAGTGTGGANPGWYIRRSSGWDVVAAGGSGVGGGCCRDTSGEGIEQGVPGEFGEDVEAHGGDCVEEVVVVQGGGRIVHQECLQWQDGKLGCHGSVHERLRQLTKRHDELNVERLPDAA